MHCLYFVKQTGMIHSLDVSCAEATISCLFRYQTLVSQIRRRTNSQAIHNVLYTSVVQSFEGSVVTFRVAFTE
jgi:hypothetical protein